MRRGAFLTALTAAREYYAVEGIHELRVEIKRLRAFYKLIEFVAPSFADKPNASLLRTLFRMAGELRDIDIHQAVTLKWIKKLDLSEYFNHLKQRELRIRGSFTEISESFSKLALSNSRTKIRSAVSATSSERMRKRMNKKVKKMADELTALVSRKVQSNDDLHSVRKAAKTLRYALDIWQQCYGKNPTAEVVSARLKKTYGYLGEWRDTLLTLESVETFLRHKAGRNLVNPAAYASFQADLRRQTKRLLAAYDRGKKSLQRALDRLSADLCPKLPERRASSKRRSNTREI